MEADKFPIIFAPKRAKKELGGIVTHKSSQISKANFAFPELNIIFVPKGTDKNDYEKVLKARIVSKVIGLLV